MAGVSLRRSREFYDLILLDAYVRHRYGSQIPQHLATREFFELTRDRLTTNGVLAYNVITVSRLGGRDAAPALARTLQSVFPQVYTFQAQDSLNAVLIATRNPRRLSNAELVQRGDPTRHLGTQRAARSPSAGRFLQHHAPGWNAASPGAHRRFCTGRIARPTIAVIIRAVPGRRRPNQRPSAGRLATKRRSSSSSVSKPPLRMGNRHHVFGSKFSSSR
jgi:hypothetical protein